MKKKETKAAKKNELEAQIKNGFTLYDTKKKKTKLQQIVIKHEHI